MKKLNNFLTLAFIGLCLWMVSCTDVSEKQNPAASKTSVSVASAVKTYSVDSSMDSLKKQLAEYRRIMNTQNGVCDDCVAGFASIMLEHKMVAKQLSDEIHLMNQKTMEVKKYNSETFGVIGEFQKQSGEMENIVSLRTSFLRKYKDQIAELQKSNGGLIEPKSLIVKTRY